MIVIRLPKHIHPDKSNIILLSKTLKNNSNSNPHAKHKQLTIKQPLKEVKCLFDYRFNPTADNGIWFNRVSGDDVVVHVGRGNCQPYVVESRVDKYLQFYLVRVNKKNTRGTNDAFGIKLPVVHLLETSSSSPVIRWGETFPILSLVRN